MNLQRSYKLYKLGIKVSKKQKDLFELFEKNYLNLEIKKISQVWYFENKKSREVMLRFEPYHSFEPTIFIIPKPFF